MKHLACFLLLATLSPAFSHAQSTNSVTGRWTGTATLRGQAVPMTFEVAGSGSALEAAFLNGPASQPEKSPASSVTFDGHHLVASFNYFARTLDATLEGDSLTGSFGSTTARYPVVLHPSAFGSTAPAAAPVPAASIAGDWEVAVHSAKGESAWQLRLDPEPTGTVRGVIQRIDGDTGSLFGEWSGSELRLSHVTAAGLALYSVVPRPDGTLLVTNLIATDAQRPQQTNLVARRPAAAREQKLAAPTPAVAQTKMHDPAAPLHFSGTDLAGHTITDAEPSLQGKVVLVAIGGSWCPNCHDEAPMLESLYKQFHSRGLEVIDLSFEETDQMKDPARLRAFIARYGITYPVLLAGDPDELNQKITGVDQLNCWPTSFFIGRDGKVREIHAGFAGPANKQAHEELVHETTALVEKLLAETATAQNRRP